VAGLMLLNKSKWAMLVVATCFALLQALQPFMHAHLDTDHLAHHSNVSANDEHEELIHQSHHVIADYLTDHTESAVSHSLYTISVASGIKKDMEPAAVIDSIAFVLISVGLAIGFAFISKPNFPLISAPHPSVKRRLPASRAPPQF
jgi:putative Mn2+ efflux pump MntP